MINFYNFEQNRLVWNLKKCSRGLQGLSKLKTKNIAENLVSIFNLHGETNDALSYFSIEQDGNQDYLKRVREIKSAILVEFIGMSFL